NILAGVHQPDQGKILIDGREVTVPNPHASQQLGLAFIFQELSIVDGLSVAENIVLGQEPKRGPFFDFPTAQQGAHRVLSTIGFDHIDASALVGTLSVAEKQAIMIARALYLEARVIVMDEATSPLDVDEVEDLFKVIRQLKAHGKGIVFISHRMSEIFEIADRVTTFKDGRRVGTHSIDEITERDLVRLMVGRQVNVRFPPKTRQSGKVILKASHLENATLHDVSLELRRGEILALAGLVGSGRTELLRAIFGADKLWEGHIEIEGKTLTLHSTSQAIQAGIALVPEDRRNQGIIVKQSVGRNLTTVWAMFPFLRRYGDKKEDQVAELLVEHLQIKTPSLQQIIAYLSGGNQQKVVVGKWLALESKILLLDEPTRGIDVGAKIELYHLIHKLACDGMGVILVSSELPEVLGMADRILVMRAGKIVGELDGNATEEDVIAKSMLTQELAV
ncbi:MAG: sugar ABC transporter ATP-binding protein, partial [Chloroflexi bacterium]|nr:sugar ABC transporter ATP-binding protein [Chloroflexota bacterium]